MFKVGESETIGFALSNHTFYRAKGMVLRGKSIRFGKYLMFSWLSEDDSLVNLEGDFAR